MMDFRFDIGFSSVLYGAVYLASAIAPARGEHGFLWSSDVVVATMLTLLFGALIFFLQRTLKQVDEKLARIEKDIKVSGEKNTEEHTSHRERLSSIEAKMDASPRSKR